MSDWTAIGEHLSMLYVLYVSNLACVFASSYMVASSHQQHRWMLLSSSVLRGTCGEERTSQRCFSQASQSPNLDVLQICDLGILFRFSLVHCEPQWVWFKLQECCCAMRSSRLGKSLNKNHWYCKCHSMCFCVTLLSNFSEVAEQYNRN